MLIPYILLLLPSVLPFAPQVSGLPRRDGGNIFHRREVSELTCLGDSNRRYSSIIASPTPLLAPYYTNCALSVFCAVLATVWLKLVTALYKNGVVPASLSRKLIHTLSIPLFLLTWPFFSTSDPYAPYVAATVPVANMWKIVSAGQGGEDGLGKAVSRSGDEKEILNGPLIYTFILFLSTLFLFPSPASIVGLTQMAAGDGMADIIGRRWGKTKWRKTSQKSVQGTLGFVASAFVATFALLVYYSTVTSQPLDVGVGEMAVRVAGISLACGLVETAEVGDDNFTVPIAGTVLGGYLLGWTW
ncbi:hypothetical protein TrCOL_g8074 [Triparma columacea]|uniref:Phytol kinase n=1 Tax=Triparma columacea TaxID=722753 RepID=A0A9W7G004_9STRA|nr:hypothetical protein TrCOL_g8074 [Triparma columacea]